MLRAESLQITINSSVQKVNQRKGSVPSAKKALDQRSLFQGEQMKPMSAEQGSGAQASLLGTSGFTGSRNAMKWLAGKYLKEISGQYLYHDLYGRGKLVQLLAGDSRAPVPSVPPWGSCRQQEVGGGGPHVGWLSWWDMVTFGEGSGLSTPTPYPLCTSCFGGFTLSFAFFIYPVTLHPHIHPFC